MVEYKTREDLISEILNRSKLFIDEFKNINEENKDKLVEGVDRSPAEMIAYQLGWMKLILAWEKSELNGEIVITPTSNYKWNNLGGLYKEFYKEYDKFTLNELCIMFSQTVLEIIDLINTYSDDELFKEGGRRWACSTPSKWAIWKWIHINTVAPFKNFRSKIRKWKKMISEV